jgi:hypothetical protein
MAGIFPNVVDGGVVPASVPYSYSPLIPPVTTTALYFNPIGCANYLRPEFLNNVISLLAAPIDISGMAIDRADPAQLYRAIRRSGGEYYATATGSANAISVTSVPTFASFAQMIGVPLRIKIATTNTAAVTVNVSGFGAQALVYPGDGTPLTAGELIAGAIRTIAWDGTNFQLIDAGSSLVITVPTIKTVHGVGADFPDLIAAMTWLSKRRIAQTGSVTFQLAGAASGTATQYNYGTSSVALVHPDLSRVFIVGAPLIGAVPVNANFTITGPSVGQRATDRAAGLTVLRSRFATELYFSGGAGVSVIGSLGGWSNILIVGDRTTGVGGNGTLFGIAAGSTSFTGPVAFAHAGSIGFHIRSSLVAASSSVISLGCVGPNMQGDSGRLDYGGEFVALSGDNDGVSLNSASFRASFSTNVGHARGNASNGVNASPGSVLICGTSSGQFVLNGLSGLYAKNNASIIAPGAICTFNSFYGISTENGSIDASNSQLNSNGSYGFYNIGGRIITTGSALGSNVTGAGVSTNGAFTNATGATSTAGLSPAAGVIGNNNSLTIV